jgi:penicillin-binding protein 1B
MGNRKSKASGNLGSRFSSAWHQANRPFVKVVLALALIAGVSGVAVFGHFWWKYARVVDARLAAGPFNQASKVLSAPEPIFVEDKESIEQLLARLREAGYSDSRHNPIGSFQVQENAVEIYPGPLSYFAQEPAVVYFEDGAISRIVSLNDNTPQTAYELEPVLVTHLFDDERSKRRLFKFEDYPQVLVDAVLAIEDHRFFSHWGVDPIRLTKAVFDGFVSGEQPRGTSTLTQQLARNFFLTPDQNYTRKAAEALIALQLEMRLTKEQIFEYYSNQIFMGRSGSFNVMGMGEAARAYFNKDVRDIDLPEAALLAGLPQGPSYLNPYRHPERALNRRNQVLTAMLQFGSITEAQFKEADAAELKLAEGHIESTEAPYYVDLVNAHLKEHFATEELITQDYLVYTTLDRALQEAAVEAVRVGMEEVDKAIAAQRRWKGKEPPVAQAALVALDPATGEVKAIVGGRSYGQSQLNRVLAKRQPGSVFKPFVYAAAIDTALDEERMQMAELHPERYEDSKDAPPLYTPGQVFTAASEVDDVPTTFWFNNKPYEPANHGNSIYGLVSFREALRKSINISTVKVAEMVGYDRVADLAIRAGLGDGIKPTPALALGSYEVTPLEVAGAYTTFLNGGVMKRPYFVREVRDPEGKVLHRQEPEEVPVLDPRVAYVVTNMLEDVLDRGTAVRARLAHNFTEPAAGKTGTDDDGWFAGYTNNLLCVVWVGFDDNTDLGLEGAHSALPIWAEFMKAAHALRAYKNPGEFEVPEGIVTVELDPDTGELATYACPRREKEVFIAGSQPTTFCRFHGSGGQLALATNVAGWDNGNQETAESDAEPAQNEGLRRAEASAETGQKPSPKVETEKKRGIFGRVLGIFK